MCVIACISVAQKLDDSQWKGDINQPKLDEWSIGIYDWETQCFDTVQSSTTKIIVKIYKNEPDVCTTYTYFWCMITEL